MSKIQAILPKTTQDYLRLAMLAFTVLVIVLLFPKHSSLENNYVEGEVWQEDPLVALAAFEADMTPAQLLLAERTVNESFVPSYTRVPVREAQISSLNEKLDAFYDTVSETGQSNLKSTSISTIDSLYRSGILEYDKENPFNNGQLIIEGMTRPASSFERVETAQNSIKGMLKRNKYTYSEGELKIILEHIVPNIVLDNKKTDQQYSDVIKQAKEGKYTVPKGDTIIKRGEIVDQQTYYQLNAFNQNLTGAAGNSTNWLKFFGYLLLTALIIGALILYCRFEFPEVYLKLNNLGFILMWPVIFSILVYFVDQADNVSSFIIPFCIVPIIVKNFFNERLALFLHIVIILLASFLSKLGYEFTFLEILAGIITVLFVSETRYWNKFFMALLVILLTYLLGYFGLSAIKVGSLAEMPWKDFIWLGLATLFTLLAYPFIPLLERLFGFTSSITLAELADMNNPLLKRLSIEAPGTLQHSLQVSNLSEAAADRIGANSLLIKTAALYHDVGKLADSEIFIENQASTNPHDKMNNFESAKAIINHVTDGMQMAKKARLPKVVTDFITTHHGTTRVEYFYRNQLKEEPNREFDETLFRYPGPLPKTKEQAILMIADSIEAASKSLKNPTGKDIDELVDKIIAYKIDSHQLIESSLSFRELEECTVVFKSLLRSINHVRVEYPDAVKKNTNKTVNQLYAEKKDTSQSHQEPPST